MHTSSGPLPPVYFLGALLASAALHWVLPVAQLLDWPTRWIGAPIMIAGLILVVLPAKGLDSRGTTVKPFWEPAVLVTDGFFRYSRNPMYLGMSFALLGFAFLLGSLSPFLTVIPFMLLLDRIFIQYEEEALEAKFEGAYRDYKARVRKWL